MDAQPLSKTYRVYFNHWRDAPFIWSVDEGDISTEVNVREVHLLADCTSYFNPSRDNVDDPRAWFELTGYLRLDDGVATISAVPIKALQAA